MSHGVLRHPGEGHSAWIEERREQWPVAVPCRVPEVSRSGFYGWRSREPSAAEARREELAERITTIHAEVKGRYGSPRAHAGLVGRGHACGANVVAGVVREAGIAAKTARELPGQRADGVVLRQPEDRPADNPRSTNTLSDRIQQR